MKTSFSISTTGRHMELHFFFWPPVSLCLLPLWGEVSFPIESHWQFASSTGDAGSFIWELQGQAIAKPGFYPGVLNSFLRAAVTRYWPATEATHRHQSSPCELQPSLPSSAWGKTVPNRHVSPSTRQIPLSDFCLQCTMISALVLASDIMQDGCHCKPWSLQQGFYTTAEDRCACVFEFAI